MKKWLLLLAALLTFPAQADLNGPLTGSQIDGVTGASTNYGQSFIRTGTGTYTAMPNYQYFGACYLEDYAKQNGYSSISAQSTIIQTALVQNWLLDCQLKFLLRHTSQSFDDVSQFVGIKAIAGVGNNIILSSPIIVPRYVITDFTGRRFVRSANSGSVVNNYVGSGIDNTTGNTANYLANVQAFMFIYPPGAHNTGDLVLQANQSGTDRGAAFESGRTWQIHDMAIASPGTGYTVGDTVVTATGDSKSPYNGATATVASITGGGGTGPIGSLTFAGTAWTVASGIYPFPKGIMEEQWTTANGFSNVWDGSPSLGQLKLTGGTGTGASVTFNMWPDWCIGVSGIDVNCSASTSYYGLFSNMLSYGQYLGKVHITQSNLVDVNSATYGPIIAALLGDFETQFDIIQTQGGDIGIYVTGVDTRGNIMNTVDGGTSLKLASGGSLVVPSIVLDTPRDNYLKIDKFGPMMAFIEMFNNGNKTGNTPASVLLGSDTSFSDATHEDHDLHLIMSFDNAGASTPIPAVSCAFTRNSSLSAYVGNIARTGSANALQNSFLFTGGTNCETSNSVTGSIDNLSTTALTGTVPAAEFDIWNAGLGIREALPAKQQRTWQLSSNIAVANDQTGWVVMPEPGLWTKFYAVCKTGPVGASAIFDIQKSTNNGSSFSTIWGSTPSGKPTVADGQVAGTTTTIDTKSFAAGDVFRIDVDQIGSTTAGANCTVMGVASY